MSVWEAATSRSKGASYNGTAVGASAISPEGPSRLTCPSRSTKPRVHGSTASAGNSLRSTCPSPATRRRCASWASITVSSTPHTRASSVMT